MTHRHGGELLQHSCVLANRLFWHKSRAHCKQVDSQMAVAVIQKNVARRDILSILIQPNALNKRTEQKLPARLGRRFACPV
jgi:hypothetical protein